MKAMPTSSDWLAPLWTSFSGPLVGMCAKGCQPSFPALLTACNRSALRQFHYRSTALESEGSVGECRLLSLFLSRGSVRKRVIIDVSGLLFRTCNTVDGQSDRDHSLSHAGLTVSTLFTL
jgi:hypothetical protein